MTKKVRGSSGSRVRKRPRLPTTPRAHKIFEKEKVRKCSYAELIALCPRTAQQLIYGLSHTRVCRLQNEMRWNLLVCQNKPRNLRPCRIYGIRIIQSC